MADISEKLISIIDERVKKIINTMGFVVKYTGIVTAVSSDNTQITAVIAGYDTEFTFLNKSGEGIAVGDGVKIETDSSGLSGGWISEKFGSSNLDTIVTLSSGSWTGSVAPYSQTVVVSGMTSAKKIEVGLATTASTTQRTASRAAILMCITQATNSITIIADGIKPTIDIPIIVREV